MCYLSRFSVLDLINLRQPFVCVLILKKRERSNLKISLVLKLLWKYLLQPPFDITNNELLLVVYNFSWENTGKRNYAVKKTANGVVILTWTNHVQVSLLLKPSHFPSTLFNLCGILICTSTIFHTGKTDCSNCHSSNGILCRACLKVRYGEGKRKVEFSRNKNSSWRLNRASCIC